MQTTLRTATRSDTVNIAALVNRAYRPGATQRGWTHESDLVAGDRTSREQVLSLFRPNSIVLLLSTDARIVACAHVEKAKNQVAQIGMLASDPDFQDRGLGKHMLLCAEKFAAKKFSAAVLSISVLSARAELIAFYERRGYKKSGSIESYPIHAGIGQPIVRDLQVESLSKIV